MEEIICKVSWRFEGGGMATFRRNNSKNIWSVEEKFTNGVNVLVSLTQLILISVDQILSPQTRFQHLCQYFSGSGCECLQWWRHHSTTQCHLCWALRNCQVPCGVWLWCQLPWQWWMVSYQSAWCSRMWQFFLCEPVQRAQLCEIHQM